MSVIWSPTFFEIHRHEGNFVDDIDPAQFRVELDAVEDHRLPADQRNVPQMQIAMAFAHPPIKLASSDQVREIRAAIAAPRLERLQAPRAGVCRQKPA